MANLQAYVLANREQTVPMPDRGWRLFSATDEGEVIDTEDRFYATMIADGDLVPATPPAAPAKTSKGTKA